MLKWLTDRIWKFCRCCC